MKRIDELIIRIILVFIVPPVSIFLWAMDWSRWSKLAWYEPIFDAFGVIIWVASWGSFIWWLIKSKK